MSATPQDTTLELLQRMIEHVPESSRADVTRWYETIRTMVQLDDPIEDSKDFLVGLINDALQS